MYSYIKYSSEFLLHTSYSDPVLHHTYSGNSDTIKSCIFNPLKKQIITGSNDGYILIFNLNPKTRPIKFKGHTKSINEVSINPLGNLIASCSDDSTIRLWKNDKHGFSNIVKIHSAPIKTIDFFPTGKFIVFKFSSLVLFSSINNVNYNYN